MSTASPTICHYSTPVMCVEFFFIVNMDIYISFMATPSAMNKWPYKREGFYWEGLFIRILLSQCIWNDGLRWHGGGPWVTVMKIKFEGEKNVGI